MVCCFTLWKNVVTSKLSLKNVLTEYATVTDCNNDIPLIILVWDM